MVEIYKDEATEIVQDDDNLIVVQSGVKHTIPIREVETVAELSPCVTMGKYLDIRVITIRTAHLSTIYFPVSKESAKRILTAIQQIRLNASRMRRHDSA